MWLLSTRQKYSSLYSCLHFIYTHPSPMSFSLVKMYLGEKKTHLVKCGNEIALASKYSVQAVTSWWAVILLVDRFVLSVKASVRPSFVTSPCVTACLLDGWNLGARRHTSPGFLYLCFLKLSECSGKPESRPMFREVMDLDWRTY